ncbi:hypothetical protein [Clostridium hydrogenum]|uniref:hypothetical protein n=1 Tax=Clostridium hydrogenum TaxID=2855764 RepID=UPI001F25EEB3|nr:hypothetical protein [Clostridium hydrogenum]
MTVNNVYTYDPIEYNKLNQAQKGYPGIDKVENYTLKKGTILVALEGPKAGAGGNYFMTLEDFKNGNLDSINLCQGLQVNPYYDYQNENSQPQYKTNARFYVINEDILSAEGVINANTNYGKGGLQQIVVPNGSEMIKETYRNNKHSLNDTIIPIDLNKFENDERLSENTKEGLNSVKNKFSDNLSDDGSIELNNKVISEQAYDLIQMRTEIHELTVTNNCLIKEYTDELQKKDKDSNYIGKIKDSINHNNKDLQFDKQNLLKVRETFNRDQSLLDGFTVEQKEHMLSADTCCPKETLEKSEYLKAKASDLEKNLSYDEKRLLNIEDDASNDKLNNFKENTKLEGSIKEDYENYTSLDPEDIVNRDLIYTPIERDKNEDTDGRRTALGEKDQLYEENSNKNDNTSLELSNDNTMDSKKISSQMQEQNIDENEVINSEEALEKVQNQNYLTNEETENSKVLEENLVNDSKVDIENDEIKIMDEAAASESSEEDSVIKVPNENLEQNQNCEDENFGTSKTADYHSDMSIVESIQAEKDQQAEIAREAEKVDIEHNEETNNSELNANDYNNDMLSFDDNLEKLDNENCDEATIGSSVNCNSTASIKESDENLDEDEDEFYDY